MGQTFHQPSEDEIKNVFAQIRNGKSDIARLAEFYNDFTRGVLKLGGSYMKMEDAQESPAPQAQMQSATVGDEARAIKPMPAVLSDLQLINKLAAELKHWSQLCALLQDRSNWPLFFETRHRDCDEVAIHIIIADALVNEFAKRAAAVRTRLRKLQMAEDYMESSAVMVVAEAEAETRGREQARKDIAALRAEIATLGNKLIAAQYAREVAETKARSAAGKAAAAKRAANKAAPKRKPASKPARKRR